MAFPVIGPGIVLKFPLSEAIQVLTENIRQFGLSASSGSLSTIHIVIKPDYPDSEQVTIMEGVEVRERRTPGKHGHGEPSQGSRGHWGPKKQGGTGRTPWKRAG